MKKNLKKQGCTDCCHLAAWFACTESLESPPANERQAALMDALSSRIHLGLDLRGGAHLILQVVVSEAVSATRPTTSVAPDSAGP
jgi:preprotein translocase subunit SecD